MTGSCMRKLVVFTAPMNHRSAIVGKAMAEGLQRAGCPRFFFKASTTHSGRCDYDTAIFYGLAGGLSRVLADYRAAGKNAIYVDLGYWGRRKLERFDGYHKFALNSRHPTAYFQNRPKGPQRFEEFGIPIRPWRSAGSHVLVIGMSAKAAAAEGLRAEEWERQTIARLRKLTDRPIIYRPKPNWDAARPIDGSLFGKGPTLEQALVDCHAVVAHHSNAAVEALLAGVPCICPDGVASLLSGHDLTQIESPPMPDGREQFAWDLAWTQWSVDEMKSGAAYRYLLEEGLLG